MTQSESPASISAQRVKRIWMRGTVAGVGRVVAATARGLGILLALATGAVLLAGCAASVHTATPPTRTPSSSLSPESSASPTPLKPLLSQLVVSPDGLGYLAVGQPVPTVPSATAIVTFDPTACVNTGNGVNPGDPGAGAWLADYPRGASSLGSMEPFDLAPVNTSTDPVGLIEIWSPELKTAKQIGVGATVAQLTAAYGSQLLVDRASNSDVYVLRGTRSELLFEVAKAPSGLAPAQIGTVVWMRIVPLGSEYLHIANTDAAGACAA